MQHVKVQQHACYGFVVNGHLQSEGALYLNQPGFVCGQPIRDEQGKLKPFIRSEKHADTVAVLTTEGAVARAIEKANPGIEVTGTTNFELHPTESYYVQAVSVVEQAGEIKIVDEEFCLTLRATAVEGVREIVWDDFTHSTVIGTVALDPQTGDYKATVVDLDTVEVKARA